MRSIGREGELLNEVVKLLKRGLQSLWGEWVNYRQSAIGSRQSAKTAPHTPNFWEVNQSIRWL